MNKDVFCSNWIRSLVAMATYTQSGNKVRGSYHLGKFDSSD